MTPESPVFTLRKDAPSAADIVLEEVSSLLSLSPEQCNLSASFLQHGGQSLSAIRLSKSCKKRGCRLSVGKILKSSSMHQMMRAACMMPDTLGAEPAGLKIPTAKASPNSTKMTPRRTRRLSEVYPEMPASPISPVITAHAKAHSVIAEHDTIKEGPLSEMQLSFVHGSMAKPGSNLIRYHETYKTADLPKIKSAWRQLTRLEPIFRCEVDVAGESGVIRQAPEASFSWFEVVVHSEARYQELLAAEPEEVHLGSSFKVITFPAKAISTVVWRIHHVLIDGYSANLVRQKLRAILNNEPVEAGTPFTQVARSLQALQKSATNLNNKFWENKAAELTEAVGDLALAKPSQQDALSSKRVESVTVNASVDRLSEFSKTSQVSLAAVYYAAWAMAMSAFTDSESVKFGTVLSGRNISVDGALDTIGPLINTLPLVVSVDKSWSAAQFIRDVFERMVELSSVHTSSPSNGFQRDFSTALAMQFEVGLDADDNGPKPVEEPYFKVSSDIPLSVTIHSSGDVRLDYHSDIYNPADILLLSECFREILTRIAEPNMAIGQLMRQAVQTSDQETSFIMGNGSRFSTFPESIEDDLVTLFEKTARANPEAFAVEKGDERLTYRELDTKASQLAWQLMPYVRHGDVICVHADRSINWIVAIYGILKAGATYSPLDAALPANIRSANFKTAGAKLFLTPATSQKSVAPGPCFSVEELLEKPEQARIPHRTFAAPASNAYICFTSGSTGQPKGVVCRHGGLVAFQLEVDHRLMAQPGVRVSQLMSPAFDGSIHEIFSTLSYGATLVLAFSADPFAHLEHVNSALMTPSVAKTLDPEDYPELQNLYVVGEPLQQWVNDTWASQKRLYNMYGPTEATCGSTTKLCVAGRPVTVGLPNPSSRVYILDRTQDFCPTGVAGEIFIAGVQVALGYIGRPEETASRFLPDPFYKGQYMYKTGDRGFFDRAGEVNIMGRRDRQIKLRGFRCDLNDLEARVASISGVTAVGIAQKSDYLVAMIQPADLDYSFVKSQLVEVLPVHAVPRDFALVDAFPKTKIGKLDYKALIDQVQPRSQVVNERPLSTDTERAIAEIWKECLNTANKLSPDSSFKALGGTSILQLLMHNRLAKRFERHVPFKAVLQSPTLGDLAKAVDALLVAPKAEVAVAAQPLGETKPSPMELEWLEKFKFGVSTSAFNVTFACELGQTIQADRLETALNTVLSRHAILRCRFTKALDGTTTRTFIHNPPTVKRTQRIDLWRESHKPFDHARDYPMFAIMSEKQLFINISHIICDLTTLESLLSEVATVYQGGELPAVQRSFFQSSWTNQAATTDLDFWSKYLDGLPASPFAREDFDAKRWSYSGTTLMSKLSSRLCKQTTAYSQKQGITLHQLALTAMASALSAESSTTDVVLGAPYLNRSADDMRTVGLFLEPLVIRVKYDPTSNSAASQSMAEAVQDASQAALAHAVPWNQLLKHLDVQADFPNHPLMDVMVTVHDNRGAPRLGLEDTTPLMTWTSGAKFTLMCEFSVLSDETCAMRLEYDDKIIAPDQIEDVRSKILTALDCVTRGMDYRETKKMLAGGISGDELLAPQTGFFYGKSLASL